MKEIKKTKGNGIASMILGILSLCLIFMPYFGIPIGIMAIILGNKQSNIYETGSATAGKTMGIIGIVLNSVMALLVVVLLLFGAAV